MPFSTLPTLGQLEQFLTWLFGDALSWANIVQVPALFLTGGVAWVLRDVNEREAEGRALTRHASLFNRV